MSKKRPSASQSLASQSSALPSTPARSPLSNSKSQSPSSFSTSQSPQRKSRPTASPTARSGSHSAHTKASSPENTTSRRSDEPDDDRMSSQASFFAEQDEDEEDFSDMSINSKLAFLRDAEERDAQKLAEHALTPSSPSQSASQVSSSRKNFVSSSVAEEALQPSAKTAENRDSVEMTISARKRRFNATIADGSNNSNTENADSLSMHEVEEEEEDVNDLF